MVPALPLFNFFSSHLTLSLIRLVDYLYLLSAQLVIFYSSSLAAACVDHNPLLYSAIKHFIS